jgi:uncharacterized protein YodC (DUF2158 family)
MKKKNIQCSLAGLGEDDGIAGSGMIRVQRCRLGDGVGPRRHGLREDDVVAGSGMASRTWG